MKVARGLLLLFASTAEAWSRTKRDVAPPKITWVAPCPHDLDARFPAGTECGSLAVPIDYGHPQEGSFDLWLFRLKANGTKSLGSLFFNTGGPGGAASDYFAAMKTGRLWSSTVLASYDLVGVDPRGIGLSSPVQCDPAIFNTKPQLLDAGDDAGFAKSVAFNKALGKSCLDRTGKLINFMDSVSTVKDFELVRQAVNSDKFHFLGLSYGTVLGQTYAELYPDKVGRMVLDGDVDRRSAGIDSVMTEALTFQATLQKFFEWCSTDDSCALKGQDVRGIFAKLTAKGNVVPANCTAASPCFSQVTGEDIIARVQPALVTQNPVDPITPGWSLLSEALEQANRGNATLLSPPLAKADSTATYAFYAVGCQDYGSLLKTAGDVRRVLDVVANLLPLNRGICEFLDIAISCVGWPAPLTNPPRALDPARMAKAPQVLLVNSFFDPESSAVWAAGLREQMPNAVSLWRNGTGHTSYFLLGDTSKAIDAFLVEGILPADETVLQS